MKSASKLLLILSLLLFPLIGEGNEGKCQENISALDNLLYSQYCSNQIKPKSSDAKYDPSLLQKASREGMIRVIVRVKEDFLPEGLLKDDTIRSAQREAIKNKQDYLLNKLTENNISKVKRFSYIPYLSFYTDTEGLRALIADPMVHSVREDRLSRPTLSQSVPIVEADRAWTGGYTGAGQTIAVLDTGFQTSHPFLSGKVVEEACYSSTNDVSTTLCPNGEESQTGNGAAINCNPSISHCDHGTHVAGIAAGKGDNFSGMAKDANLIAIQVFSRFDTYSYCGNYVPCLMSYDSDQIRALERVYELKDQYKIASVNMSIGGDRYTENCDYEYSYTKEAIDNLRSVGIATVIAAGNDGFSNALNSPGCISTAVSVGATTKSEAIASFSNSANMLSILAPGSTIYSSTLNSQYGYKSGTSMATPHVAGAWALMKQKRSSATVSEILNALQQTGRAIGDTRNGITKSRINIFAALNSLSMPVFRFFNTQAGGHFFTLSETERDHVRNSFPHFNYEGIGFYAYSQSQGGAVPVFRFFNTQAGGHFFTLSETERDHVRNSFPHFNYEGIGFYAYSQSQGGAVPVFRFFNTQAGGHFFTLSETERDHVRNTFKQFNFEGTGFYALP